MRHHFGEGGLRGWEFGGVDGRTQSRADQTGMGVATNAQVNERDCGTAPTHAVAPIAMREPKQ